MGRLKELSGERFGKLTVLHRSEEPHSRVYWTCRCDCGNIVEATTSNLKSGHVVSCGCRRVSPYIGKRYGKLVVLEKTEETVQHGSTKSPLWKCRCDCGNIVLVRLDSLTSGTTRSCGCMTAEKVEKMREAAGYIEGTQVTRIRKIMEQNAGEGEEVIGVTYQQNKWRATIKFQGKKYNLGRYDNRAEAAEARRFAEKELFGAFLEKLNKPEGTV